MDFTTIMLAIIVMVIIFTVYIAIVRIPNRKDDVSERMKRMNPSIQSSADSNNYMAASQETLSPMAASLEQIVSVLPISMSKLQKKMQPLMAQSGISSPDVFVYYVFMRTFGTAIFFLLAATLYLSDPSGLNLLMALFIAVVGFFAPDLYITNRKQGRQQALSRSFPDAIDLILVCVESGLALDGALSRVCKELGHAHPEITHELNRTRLELTLLNDRTQALQNLALRTDIPAFKALTASLIQTEKFGTSLADTLRILAEDYRLERLNIAEQKAGRLPALMTIPLMLCLIPALFMVILGPAIIGVVQIFSAP